MYRIESKCDFGMCLTMMPCLVVAVVEGIWDPLSLQQTRRLTTLVQRLIDDYPTVNADSKPTQVPVLSVASGRW